MGWPHNTVHVPIQGSAQTITGVGTASATSSSALPAATTILRIVANSPIWYNTAGSASAASGSYLPADTVEYVACGGSSVITIMAVTTTGRTAWITPCSS